MKNLVFSYSVLSFMLCLCLNAQEPEKERKSTSQKNKFFEIGINLYDFYLPEYPELYTGHDTYGIASESNFFRGMNFKYYFNKNALRASIDYYRKKDGITDYEFYSGTGFSKTTVASLGYQRLLRKGKFSPYFFVDLNYLFRQQKGLYSYNQYALAFPGYYNQDYLINTSIYGFSQGLGIRYNPIRSLVINLETSFQQYELARKSLRDKSGTHRSRDAKLNPLQLSIAFIF